MTKIIVAQLPTDVKKILFVCTANICRSAAAAGILKMMLLENSEDIEVSSAGTHALPGKSTTSFMLHTLKQSGLNIEAHRSRQLTPAMVNQADVIFVMELAHRLFIVTKIPESKSKVFLLSDFHPTSIMVPAETNIPDPIGMNDFFYENVNEMIHLSCRNIANQLKEVCPEKI